MGAPSEVSCSNCGKGVTEVRKIIRAAEFFICDECVIACVAILEAEGVFAAREISTAKETQ